MNSFFELIRVKQWYKNLMIFLPILFTQQIFNLHALWLTFIGFVGLCCISSSGYIINDIVDRKKDKHHEEKRKRPIASGKINVAAGIFFAVLLLAASFFLSFSLNVYFLILTVIIFLNSLIYSVFLKNEAFVDILSIAINFVLRAFSGAIVIVINFKPWIRVSPWLIFCPFFLSIFLSVMKREGDIKLLGRKAVEHKKSLVQYSPDIIDKLSVISTTLLVISYALLTVMSPNPQLIVTMPFALYVIFRYFYLAETKPEIVRNPEKSLADLRILIGTGLYFISVFLLLYL
ncbi:UbiA prenyltransferase family protein [Candidatus Woesearchaeota archaeon]|nr:UbiA prenyltransferase family protein [Candidatus Woesearchaeota archaeon]